MGEERGVKNFLSDLPKGEEGEQEIITLLKEEYGFKYIKNSSALENNLKEFDFIMEDKNGIPIKIEVKTDLFCSDEEGKTNTNNIAIEFFDRRGRGRQTGIAVTTSDLFVYYFKHLNEVWILNTIYLKKLFEEYNKNHEEYPFISVRSGGDDMMVRMYLMNKYELKDITVSVNNEDVKVVEALLPMSKK